ncbi:MAG: Rrf2 family transcriptional regulator [Bacteroidia bacterium]|nr:Rrf2 family transcriptional regulator [Bacteroidia bacterium]
MLYSKTAQYSIQSMLFIAANSSEQNILVRDVARELGLPSSFLSKILQTLSRYGFLNSVKGPKGGFSLSEKGANSTIAELVAVVDGPMNFDMCLAGFTPCSEENACPFHHEWKRIREEIRELVNSRDIHELAVEMPVRYRVLLTGKATPVKKMKKEAPKAETKPAKAAKAPAKAAKPVKAAAKPAPKAAAKPAPKAAPKAAAKAAPKAKAAKKK